MRTRKEVDDASSVSDHPTIDVLLDIRDLLGDIKQALQTKNTCPGSGAPPENLYALGPASKRGVCPGCKREVDLVRANDRANSMMLVEHPT